MSEQPIPARAALAAVLDLPAAVPLRERLLEALGAGEDLVLDGSLVEQVSTGCLQVLVAAARAAQHEARRFSITDPSAVLASAADDLALRNALSLGN